MIIPKLGIVLPGAFPLIEEHCVSSQSVDFVSKSVSNRLRQTYYYL